MNSSRHIIRSNIKEILTDKIPEENKKDCTEAISELNQISIEKPVVYLGTSTCGKIAGAESTLAEIKNYKSASKNNFEIKEVGCTGYCSEEPIMDVQLPGRQRLSFRKVLYEDVSSILDATFNNYPPRNKILGQYHSTELSDWPDIPHIKDLDFYSSQRRNILNRAGIIDPESLEEYISFSGYKAFVNCVTGRTSEDICDIMIRSKLKGRSGSGYLTGEKWKNGLNQKELQKYFICNADESDPGSFVDRGIAESDPHLVIEGIAIGSYAIKANQAYIYIRNRYQQAIKKLEKAIEDCYNYGLLGDNIFGSGFNLNIKLIKSPGAFVCGEETALIKTIEGKRGMPDPKPPYPSESGLFGKPTIVNNLETISNVKSILENGAEWFAKQGSEKSAGTKLFSVSGKISKSGIIEIPMGYSIRDIISTCGGIPGNNDLKAVHIGGPSGGFLSLSELDLHVDFDEMTNAGVWMGSGSFLVLDHDNCVLNTTKYFIELIRKESCGKCIPCREGSQRIYEILERITTKPAEDSNHFTLQRFKGVMQLEDLAEVMKDTSLCGLGQHAPDSLLSSLKKFKHEYESHIFDRHCDAGVCRGLKNYSIDVDKCTGCTICATKCPEDAIIGTIRQPHFIIEEKCTSCGICYSQCKFNAINVK